MALAFDAALTAVELLDVGWSRLTRSKTRSEKAAEQVALEERALVLEGELAKERVETRKLQAAIDAYKELLLTVHKDRGMGIQGPAREDGSAAGCSPLATEELLKQVEEKINSPAFLDHLLAPPDAVVVRGDASGAPVGPLTGAVGARGERDTASAADGPNPGQPSTSGGGEATPTRVLSSGGHMEVCIEEDEDADCWQWVTAREMRGGIRSTTEACAGLDGEEDYELVDGEDVVDGISLVLARFIASQPEYQGLSAEELQKAMSAGFKDSKGKGVFRALWDWSKFAYKASRWATAAYSVYRRPLMVRAILLALISSTRVILGFTLG